MTANLVVAKVDLEWADNQYWLTLNKVVSELNKIMRPNEKRKLKTSEAQKFIR